MKPVVIGALICLNAALVVALVFGATTQQAYGQVLSANYLVITGQVSSDYDVVYVVDLGTRRLAAWRFDKTHKRLIAVATGGGRDLMRDFGRTKRSRR